MNINIETGVPLPPQRRSRKYSETLSAMKDGDSFTAPRDDQRAICSAAWHSRIKVMTRKIDETTVRVWRTSQLPPAGQYEPVSN
jgi:hypothetical protein